MTIRVVVFACLCLCLILPASAADYQSFRYGVPPVVGPHPPTWQYNRANPPPFARSVRAQAELDSGACWRECSAYCAASLGGCVYEDTQGRCLAYTDSCNLDCQRSCRGLGSGPFLPID